MSAFARSFDNALRRAAIDAVDELDLIEWEAATAFHELAYANSLAGARGVPVSPSGGVWAQNPLFCTGLVNAAEAILQVAGRAGAVQIDGARRAAAHGCHGFAQQGHAVAVFEGVPH